MRNPRSLAARGLPVLTWGLTFHILAIALLFGLFRLPLQVVRAIAAWKEVAGALLLLAVVVRAVRGAGPRVHVAAADLLAAGWIGIAIVFALTENVVLRENVPIDAAVLGLRDAAFFVIFYFVGRATPEIANANLFRRAYWVLLVTCAIAVLEQLLVTPQMLVAIGVAAYVQNFLGTEAYTQGNVYGLPDNYWSQMGSHWVRRSGSVFLSSQGFAMIFLVLLPAATICMLDADTRKRIWWRTGYAVIWAGLLVTFTRAAIFVGAMQLAVLLALRRRVTGIALAASVGVVILLVGLVAVPGLATFAFETLTWQSGSSASHAKDFINGVTAFLEQPWGNGLGTTDQAAVRAGLMPLTADNLYLKYAVELGAFGVALMVGTLASFAGAGIRLVERAVTPVDRQMGEAVLLATCGVLVYGMTSAIFTDPMVADLLFWFAGAAVTLAQRADDARGTAAIPMRLANA